MRPARVSAALAVESANFHVVSGLNLGMLTEALMLKDCMDIAQLKEHIMTSAADTIVDIGSSLTAALREEQTANHD